MRISDLHRRILAQKVPLDPDAQAFLTVTGITNNTIKNAVNDLVVSLKNNNLWGKLKVIYPFVGGTAFTHKFNLKDPRDLDAAYRIDFVNNPTHSSNGVQGNGIDQYGNINLQANELLQDSNFAGWYSRTDLNGSIADFATRDVFNTNNSYYAISRDSNQFLARIHRNLNAAVLNSDSRGFLGIGRTSSSSIYFNIRNSVTTVTHNRNFTASSLKIFIMAENNNDLGPRLFSSRQYAFFCFGENISGLQSGDLGTIVNNFQTTLGRQV
jgi:hypothetical protein